MASINDVTLTKKQYIAFSTMANEVLFGGSMGGGKSFLMRYASIIWALYVPGIQIYLFRRKYNDLEKNHLYGPQGYAALLDELSKQKKVKINYSNLRIDFVNGSQIFLCHCQHEHDMYNYQGAEIHVLLIDELTLFTKKIYEFLRSRVRLGSFRIDYDTLHKKMPFIENGYFPRILCGSNPGNVLHSYVKSTFVDYAPPLTFKRASNTDGGMLRMYIPSLVWENPFLLEQDPTYIDRVKGLGDPSLVKAMLDGDWDVIAGGALDDLWDRNIHVVQPFKIPSSWYVDRGMDWGSSKPSAILWFAESDGSEVELADGTIQFYPAGTIFVIEEYYTWNGQPNEGNRTSTKDLGVAIKEIEQNRYWGKWVNPGPADNMIFNALNLDDTIESLHDHMLLGYNGLDSINDLERTDISREVSYISNEFEDELFTRSDKSPGSRKKGLEIIRTYLKGSAEYPMENKGIFFFSNCIHSIRTLSVLPRSDKDPEDVNSDAEDHCFDTIRYRILNKSSQLERLNVSGM